MRQQKLVDLDEGLALDRYRVVACLNEELGDSQIAARRRGGLGRLGERLVREGDGCGQLGLAKRCRSLRTDVHLAVKDVLVALLATCLPLPSLSLAFCEREHVKVRSVCAHRV